jgi:hypothetical protein
VAKRVRLPHGSCGTDADSSGRGKAAIHRPWAPATPVRTRPSRSGISRKRKVSICEPLIVENAPLRGFHSRGRGVTAAYRPFKPWGEGSSPSGPIILTTQRLVAQRSSTRLITERRRFNSSRADSFAVRDEFTKDRGTKAQVAEHQALNQACEGSSPSGPMRIGSRSQAMHWWSSGKDAAPVPRSRGFESHPVLSSLTIRRDGGCAHDVAAAYCLAMADVRVRLPLGTSSTTFGAWGSGDPPVSGTGERRFDSGRPDSPSPTTYRGCVCWYTRLTVNEERAGSIPAPGALFQRKGKPIGDGTCLENRRAMSLEGSTPSPSAAGKFDASLAEGQRHRSSKPDTRVRLAHGALGNRLTVGCLLLNQVVEVQILLPESGAVAVGRDATF